LRNLKVGQLFSHITNSALLISVIVLIVEIQQNRAGLLAESSYLRAEMAIENGNYFLAFGLNDLPRAANGEQLTAEQSKNLTALTNRMLRYFENLHYLHNLGLLDEEIWLANVTGITYFCKVKKAQPSIDLFVPAESSYRPEFVSYFYSLC